MLMIFFHCPWVSKGITDVSLTICIPGRGSQSHKCVRFGVSEERRSCIAKISDEQSGAAADDELADGDDDVNQ